jgi:hypothetical protein
MPTLRQRSIGILALLVALILSAAPALAATKHSKSRHRPAARCRVIRSHHRRVVRCTRTTRRAARKAAAHKATRKARRSVVAKAAGAGVSPLVIGLNANVSGWGGASTPGRMTQVAGQTGAKWLREEFNWATIEPSKGSFNWSYYDHFMTVAAQQGEHILVVFDGTPRWAGATSNTIPSDPSTYAGAVAALAARYGAQGSFWTSHPTLTADPIGTVELINEPYFSNGDSGDYNPARYAQLVKASATAGRAANPAVKYLLSAEVTGVQHGSTWTDWVDALYQAVPNLNNYFDGVAIHPYGADFTGLSGLAGNQMRRTELLRQEFLSHGAADKPMWITEIGWPTCTNAGEAGGQRCTTEAGQVAELNALIGYLKGGWAPYVQGVFLYHYQDFSTNATDSEANYGMTTVNGQAKPILALFKGWAATSSLANPLSS